MKWVDLYKTIKVTRVSFIALILFVGLCVGTLLGTGWSGPAVEILTNRYYDKQAVMDIKAMSADGFKEKTVERIRDIDDVSVAEGIYTADAFMLIEGEKELFSVISVTDSVNKAEVLEGTLPKENDEIAVDEALAKKRNYSIGEVITLDSSLKELTGYDIGSLGTSRFRITAFVHHPEFIVTTESAPKGYSSVYRRQFKYYALVDKSAFNEDVYKNGYTSVLMRLKSVEGMDRFANDYNDRINAASDQVQEELGSDDKISFTDITSSFGYYSAKMAGETGGKVASVFAGFFFAIGLLVCFSTILRLIEDETRLIGTKMANGFTRATVASKYLMYVTAAVALGFVLGIANTFMISRLTQQTVTSTLVFGGTYNYYDIKQLIAVMAAEYAAMLLMAWFASARQMRRKIVSLLNNSKENSKVFELAGKISLVRKASVSVQSFIYNISMDSSRVIATVVGTAGSIALLIAPASLFLVMQASPQVQFEELFKFDHYIQYEDEDSHSELIDVLDDSGSEYAEVYAEDAILSRKGAATGSVRIIAVEDIDSFNKIVRLEDLKTDERIELDDDGVMVWQAEGKDYGTSAGDVMKISSYNGDKYEFKVSGLYKCYDSGSYRMFMTSDVYEKATGKDFENNAVLAGISKDIAKKISDIDGVLSCNDEVEACNSFYSTMTLIYAGVLGMVLFLSAVIAFLILLNLNIQFVREKKMELIVMRINGFSVGAAKMYIIRDNIFLSVISIIIGLGAGIAFGRLLNDALQMRGQCIINDPSPAGCAFGVIVTMIYMIITNLIAVRPISKLDLTDISKM